MLIARYAEKAGNVTNPAEYSISFFLPCEKSTNAPKIAEYFITLSAAPMQKAGNMTKPAKYSPLLISFEY